MRHLTERGLTLVELMVALAIGAFLVMSAAPFFGEYTTNSRLRESGSLLYAEALIAQSEALKRNNVVRLSTSGNTIQVIDRAVPNAPVVLRQRTFVDTISADTATLDFGSQGLPSPFGTSASINISKSGVICSSDLRCPGLRVDAGGAIRLCGDTTGTC